MGSTGRRYHRRVAKDVADHDDPEPARRVIQDLLDLGHAIDGALRVPEGVGVRKLLILAFTARARRLARATMILADAGLGLEAMVLLRSQLEFLLTLHWLLQDTDTRVKQWKLADLEWTVLVAGELKELGALDVVDPTVRRRFEEKIEEFRSEAMRGRSGDSMTRMPSVKKISKALDVRATYSLAYRFDSNMAAHPSATAVDVMVRMDETSGDLVVGGVPRGGLQHTDPYTITAFVLRDFMALVTDEIPELGLSESFSRIAARVDALRDPPA
jgi:hypothetical protein